MLISSFFNSANFNILIVGIAVGAIALLGFTVYFNNRESSTNRAFLFYCLAVVLWGISNFFEYQFQTIESVLWALRIHLFISVWYSLAFFRLSYVFLNKNVVFPNWYKYFIIPFVIITSILTLTPFVFAKVAELAPAGQVTKAQIDWGIVLFGLTAFGLLFVGLVVLFRRALHSKGIESKQLWLIFIGMFLTACLTLTFNLILPVVFENVSYIPFAALFILPFIGLISYTIYKHKLFNLKVAAIAFVAFILSLFSLFNIIYAINLSQTILNATFFTLILLGSIILIQSILKEIKLKEEFQKLNIELGILLKQRESLVHLVTHKVKGSFTRSKYIFAEMLEGTFGVLSEEAKKVVKQGLDSDNEGIATVDLVLNAANLQKGTIKYEIKPVDLKEIVIDTINQKKGPAELKALVLETEVKDGNYSVLGDKFWLKEVVYNLVDNAVKYTPAGKIIVGLELKDGKILFYVKDTGGGITDEDKKILFTEGGRGRDSVKVNVDSTGYGLYTIKLIVDAHKGRVWFETELGKGTTFFVELPPAQTAS